MSKLIKVGDLHDQIGYDGPRSILYCSVCGAEYSANKGDYFALPDSHVFECCGFPCARVVKSEVFAHVEGDHI